MITPVQFYQIVRQDSSNGMSLRPLEPNVADSLIIQDVPRNPVQPEFLWGFIDDGTERYRIFNCFSGLTIASEEMPPFQDEKVQQTAWQYGLATQEWYFDGTFFISAVNSEYVWQVMEDTALPHGVILSHKTGLGNQKFTLVPASTPVVAAAQGAGT